MPEYTKQDALTFIETLRLTVANRVGFKWLTGKLVELNEFIESTVAENERLQAYIDRTGSRDEYEAFRTKDADK